MTNRFGDIDADFKRLAPVYGYPSEKLVSIEKALEPIEPEINNLSYYIEIAKTHCRFPSEHGLSIDQSAAVYIYTMEWGDTTLYRVLNRALRSENRMALKVWFPYLKLFDTALDKLPVVKEVVWRGIPLNIGKDFIKDQIFTWWSINSCSSSVNVIKTFLKNDKNSTLFLIEAVNGKQISGYTEHETEDEVILRMGTQFRVKSNALDHPNGSHVVHLIEIDGNNDKSMVSIIKETDSTTTSLNPNDSKIKSQRKISEDIEIKEISDDENMLKLIKDEIINVLVLDISEKKDEILKDLLENGQQSLKNYEEYFIPDIYKEIMNKDNNKLIKYLKDYFELNWKIENSSNKWFIQFLNESKSNENHDLYEQVLIRTAKYGKKFMKNSSILSICLQILFEGIDDKYLEKTNIFDELWFTIITNGLKSIIKYSEYIIIDIMNEQINNKQSILFQALREYHREKLFQLFEQCNIKDRLNLYELALNSIVEFGWKIGLQEIESKILKSNYKILVEKVDSYLQQQQQCDQLQKQKPRKTTSSLSPSTYTNTELMQIINQNKNKNNVSLFGQNLKSEDMEIVAFNLLQNNTTLTQLSLENNQITYKGIEYLCNVLQNNETLTTLYLGKNQITDKGVEYLCNVLQKNKTLARLYLGNNQITDKGVEYLSKVLQNNKFVQTVSYLYLEENQITDKGVEYLCNVLQNNKTLAVLYLVKNQITDKGVEYLCNVLPNNKTLTNLYLGNNPITDEGIAYLCNILQNNKTLKSIGLGSIQTTDKGVEYLGNVLQNNKTLTHISVSDSQFTDKGVEYLCNVLQNNKTLVHVYLFQNQVGNKGRQLVEKFNKTNKSLTIFV